MKPSRASEPHTEEEASVTSRTWRSTACVWFGKFWRKFFTSATDVVVKSKSLRIGGSEMVSGQVIISV
jgi:hypothetical protein